MNIKYIELKTGYADNGPAWIGNVKESKTGKTIYYNNHAFQKCHLIDETRRGRMFGEWNDYGRLLDY